MNPIHLKWTDFQGRSQDGWGVGRGEHFLPHKFIKRAFKHQVYMTLGILLNFCEPQLPVCKMGRMIPSSQSYFWAVTQAEFFNMSIFFVFYIFSYLLSNSWVAFLGAWCPLPAFRSCFVEFSWCLNALLMNLWGRKCSPRPTPPPSWLLREMHSF